MEKIDFGVGISMAVRPDKRELVESFLLNVLKCPQTLKSQEYSCFRFPNGQILGITPDITAPTEEEYERSVWFELVSNDFLSTKKRIQEFGVREVSGGHPQAFFFNIPGGAVFRLLSEEMAQAEKDGRQ